MAAQEPRGGCVCGGDWVDGGYRHRASCVFAAANPPCIHCHAERGHLPTCPHYTVGFPAATPVDPRSRSGPFDTDPVATSAPLPAEKDAEDEGDTTNGGW